MAGLVGAYGSDSEDEEHGKKSEEPRKQNHQHKKRRVCLQRLAFPFSLGRMLRQQFRISVLLEHQDQ